MDLSVHIRWMIRRDLPEVLDIEGESFELPWSEEMFVSTLRRHDCIGMVAEINERVVGFMIYKLPRNRIELLNLAVHPEFRRREIGSAMLSKLKSKLSLQRRKRITLLVRETNLPAQLFFRSCGLRAAYVVKDAFDETDEDGYIFRFSPHMEVAQ